MTQAMSLSQGQRLVQTQQLSVQQMQAMKLLQSTSLELVQEIRQRMELNPVVISPNAEQCACLQRRNMICLTNGKNRNQLIPRWPGYSSVPWTDVGLPSCFRATRGNGHRNLRCPGKLPR